MYKLKAAECHSGGRNFHFLHLLNPATIESEGSDSLNCANSFWKFPDISVQLTRFIKNGLMIGSSMIDILLDSWIVL